MTKTLKAISLFANVGIAEAYFKEIGIEVVAANEIDPKRTAFYKHIYPDVNIIEGDITSPDIKDGLVNIALNNGVNLIIATPPCQGMSTAGKMDKWDARNTLICHAIEIVKRIKPKYVFFENVPQQLTTKIKYNDVIMYIPDYVKAELGNDYIFNDNFVVEAANYGIPQYRERAIMLLARKDLDFKWEFPAPTGVVTLEQALKDVPTLDPEIYDVPYEKMIELLPDFEEKKRRGLEVSPWHYPPKHIYRQVVAMMHTPSGRTAFDNVEKYQPRKKNGELVKGFKNTYKRQSWDRPGTTITMYNREISSQGNVHPGRFIGKDKDGFDLYSDARVMSIYELMIMTSLPTNWNIPLNCSDHFIRCVIGEGIPPLLVKKIMEQLDEVKAFKFDKNNHNDAKLTGLSLFANVGVAEAYFKDIGADIVLANELLPDRARFYADVYPDTEMICGDITQDAIKSIIITKAKEKKVDFIIATPPCQGMSKLGAMKPKDVRNQLVYYAVEIIKEIKPKFVLIENVPQALITKIEVDGDIMLIPEYLKRELASEYNINEDQRVKAMDHGVPQMRPRCIFLFSRKDTGVKWEFPAPEEHIVTLKEALKDIPSLDPYLREGYDETIKLFPEYEAKKIRGLNFSKWHYPPTHNKRHAEWMMHTPSGTSAIYNEVYYPQKKDGERISAHENQYRRHSWDKPCRTITQNNGVISSLCCVHPGYPYKTTDGETLYSDPRVLSIYELLVVSSLPANWNIPSWANENFIRHVIGEGIPPLLVKKIMIELLKQL